MKELLLSGMKKKEVMELEYYECPICKERFGLRGVTLGKGLGIPVTKNFLVHLFEHNIWIEDATFKINEEEESS